jgi:TonB family protein
VLGLTLADAGFAPSTYYKFTGTVIDSSDRVVPGATLTLTNPSRGARYEIKSDANGSFEFVGLPSGDYGLEATLEGFKPSKEMIAITSANVDRRVELQVGNMTETINVSSTGTGKERAHSPRRSGFDAATIASMRQKTLATCKANGASGGEITPPTKVLDVRPVYEDELAVAKIGGTVTLEATIGGDGIVQDVTVVSAPDAGLGTAAADAVRQWEYTPTLLNCTPVEVKMGVTVTFMPK